MNNKIWLSSPHMGGTEQTFVNTAFETNWIAPLGPNVDGFEKDLSDYLENTSAVCLSSGTAALHLALILLNIGPGAEVICQSFTFSATANPILYQGATPVFVDSEKETWNMDPVFLEKAILDRLSFGKKPAAVIVVHLYGMPAKIEEIKSICEKYDIPLIEDAAEALGSHYKGKMLGTFGDFGILSFNGNKIITTSGGGALVSYNTEAINKARFYATQARDNAPHYQHSHVGYNYRMSNICAGIGRGQMQVLNDRVAKRRANYEHYKTELSDIEGVFFLQEGNESFSNRWLSCILIDETKTNGVSREKIRLALEAKNIESRPLWKPMHLQPIFEKYPYYGENVSENLFLYGLCLPSGSNLSDEDLDFVIAEIKSVFQS